MHIIVQKYGGSSVATPAQIQQVARRIVETRQEGKAVVVVVSAMGNTTNDLLKLARSVSENPQRRELDMLVTVGERISMSLLSMAIHDLGYPAVSFTGSQSGIITTNNHTNARIIRVTPVRILKALEQGKIVIVAGFQGVSERLEITSLGRGGSDTTAIALAAALEAEYAEICSNVDGVYSADPSIVPEAQRIERLSHEQMQILADSGAKVIHAEAIEWARRSGIEIRCALSTSRAPGTRVEVGPVIDQPRVLSVTAHPGLLYLSPRHPEERAPQDLEATLVAHGASDAQIWRLPSMWAALVPRLNIHGLSAFKGAIAQLGEVDIREDLTLVTALGRGLTSPPNLMQVASDALAAESIAIQGRFLEAGRVAFLVDSARANEAVKALHAALIESR